MLFNQLIFYNIHIGHKYKNTTLLASWMLFKMHNNLWLINLNKTVWFFKLIFNFIKIVVYKNGPIWFINGEMSKQYIVNLNAINCGEFYCGYAWKRGLLSNYFSMLKIIKNIIFKSHISIRNKFFFFFKTWYLTRFSWPRAIFVSNLKKYHIISKEAFTAFVPVIGMIDTDIKNYYVNFPIPSNDDSLESLSYISSIISKHILLAKYKKIILWQIYYLKYRKYNNVLNIIDNLNNISKNIIFNKFKLNKIHFNKFNVFNNLKYSSVFLFKKIGKKKKIINNFFFIEDFKVIIDKIDFFFFYLILRLNKFRKHNLFLKKERRIKLNRKFFNLNIFSLKDRFGNLIYWYFYYFYLYFMRFFRVVITTFYDLDFFTLGSIVIYEDSYNYAKSKEEIINSKKDIEFDFNKYYKLLKFFRINGDRYKDYNSKVKLYNKLKKVYFELSLERLKYMPKYLLTDIYPKRESFRFREAKDEMRKKLNRFSINLDKKYDLNKILKRELYIIFLVKFINKNTKMYKSFYGNRQII